MGDIDSLKLAGIQMKLDSLARAHTLKYDSLIARSQKTDIGQEYFTDIISHQWTLLSIQTTIFIGIITIILALFSLIAWQTVLKKYKKRLDMLEKNLQNLRGVAEKIKYYDREFEKTRMNALRALYEGIPNPEWKFIHHIRYLEWFYDHNSVDLKARIKVAEREFSELKNDKNKYKFVKTFENVGGLHAILKKIVQSKDDEISAAANRLLLAFLTNDE